MSDNYTPEKPRIKISHRPLGHPVEDQKYNAFLEYAQQVPHPTVLDKAKTFEMLWEKMK